jgi:hypothetical protein
MRAPDMWHTLEICTLDMTHTLDMYARYVLVYGRQTCSGTKVL